MEQKSNALQHLGKVEGCQLVLSAQEWAFNWAEVWIGTVLSSICIVRVLVSQPLRLVTHEYTLSLNHWNNEQLNFSTLYVPSHQWVDKPYTGTLSGIT